MTTELLAAIFRRLRESRPEFHVHVWRKAAAKSLADIGAALEAGVPPNEVAAVCFAAAEAFADPDRAAEARERCERKLTSKAVKRSPPLFADVRIELYREIGNLTRSAFWRTFWYGRAEHLIMRQMSIDPNLDDPQNREQEES